MHRWKAKLEGVIGAYGPVALGVWLGLFGLTWLGFSIAIAAGLEVESAGASASTAVAAYLATQLTKPVRVAATLVLTPVAARLLGRSPVAMASTDDLRPVELEGATTPVEDPPGRVADGRGDEGTVADGRGDEGTVADGRGDEGMLAAGAVREASVAEGRVDDGRVAQAWVVGTGPEEGA